MTLRERAQEFSKKIQEHPEQTVALLEAALRCELLDVAVTLKASADHKVKMYQELGLHGEDQARPYYEIAEAIRKRSEF